jgi:translocator protein
VTKRAGIAVVLWMALCVSVGLAGGLVTASSVATWYPTLNKPPWTPPGAVFGPVWTALYAMMGVAAWRVWRQGASPARRMALTLFAIQLTLNSLWSSLFFGLRRPDMALVDIVLLWVAIMATVVVFWRRARWAGALLLPYLGWVSFATALNAAIWQLNR